MNRLAIGSMVLTLLVVSTAFVALQARPLIDDPASEPTSTVVPADDSQELSLITATPEEGFQLAITLSRKAVTETQTDKDVLHALRPNYSHDAESLIAVSHVVAVNFQTVAAANGYWRN